MKVIVDAVDESCEQSLGRTQGQTPDIDDIVIIDGNLKKGEFAQVEIVDTVNIYDLVGRII
jgi:hypothetical protein